MTRQEREKRDAAFELLLQELRNGHNNERPAENGLLREMIAARVRMGWTQAQLAERLGTTQSAVARLERGGSSPNIKTLQRLAEVTHSRLVVRLDAREL